MAWVPARSMMHWDLGRGDVSPFPPPFPCPCTSANQAAQSSAEGEETAVPRDSGRLWDGASRVGGGGESVRRKVKP